MSPTEPKFDRRKALTALGFGCVGGAAPSLLELAARAQLDQIPTGGYYLAMAIFAFLGGVVAVAYKELVSHKAFLLGVGTPALIVAGGSVVDSRIDEAAHEEARLERHGWTFDLVSVALAQEASEADLPPIEDLPGTAAPDPRPIEKIGETKPGFWTGFCEAIGMPNLCRDPKTSNPPRGPPPVGTDQRDEREQ